MERARPTLFVIVVVAAALLAACGGGASPSEFFSPGAPLPELQMRPNAASIVLKPKALAFSGIGKAFAKKVVVSEKGYTGTFVERSTCDGIVKASPASGNGPKLSVKLTPVGSGTCAITFVDKKKHKAKLSIASGAAPTPTPATTPTPFYTPTPTPCPTCPTPTPRPTSTPNAGTIFVTYTASTAHPNVVAYDAQGNKKATGTWGSSGSSPQSIAWAPGDLNWFYVVNGGSVKVYTSSGGQLSSLFTSVTAAGAIAYPSGVSNLLYVTSTSGHTIHAYDEDGNLKSLSPGFPSSGIDTDPGGLAYDSNMGRVYVSNTSNNKVEYYAPNGSFGNSISAPGACSCTPGAIAFDPNNNHIYVWWSGTGGGMFAYDEAGNGVSLTAVSGSPFAGLSSPHAIVANSVNKYLYVTDGTSVKVFDANGTSIATTGTFSPGFTASSANGITIKP